jgi:hypothetical protein
VYVTILLFTATAVVVWLWIEAGAATAVLFGVVGLIGALAAAARSGREERRYLRGSVDTRDAPPWQPGLTPTLEDRRSPGESTRAADDLPRS